MSEVGALLELLHGPAEPRYRTVRGVLHHHADTRQMGRARLRVPEQPHGLVVNRMFPPDEPLPERTETTIRLWLELPARLREEIESNFLERDRTITVVDGSTWTVYSARADVAMSESVASEGPGMHGDELWRSLLDSAELIPALDFDLLGEVEHAGRRALRVAARARERSWLVRAPFPLQESAGADEYELFVDAERGIVLRFAALLDGEAFWITGFQELAFDEELPAERFVFEPPPGVEVRSPRETSLRERLTVEEAAARASFDVFHIPRLPEGGWEVHAMYMKPQTERSGTKETVHLMYHRTNGQDHLSVVESRFDPEARPWPALVRVERNGIELDVARPIPGLDAPVQVRCERDGTQLHLSSRTLGEDALVDLAASMQRVA